jgi:hypothetical protein
MTHRQQDWHCHKILEDGFIKLLLLLLLGA